MELPPGMAGPEMPAPTGAAPAPGPVTPTVLQGGVRARAAVQVSLAMKLLEQAFPAFGASSKEGQEILEALRKLGKSMGGQPAPGLQQSEVQALGQSVQPPGAPQQGGPAVTPGQRQAMQQTIQSRFGMPGAAA